MSLISCFAKIVPVVNDLRRMPRNVWPYTIVLFIDVARKTIFNVENEVGEYGDINQSSQLALVFELLAAFVVLQREYGRLHRLVYCIMPFMLYHILGLFSWIWADNHIAIVFKASEVVLSMLLVTVVIDRIKELRMALTYVIFLCFAPILFDLWARGFSFFHTNLYTFSAAMGLMLCIGGYKYNVYKRNEILVVGVLFAVALVIGTSTASYFAAICGFIAVLSCSKHNVHYIKLLCFLALGAIFYYITDDIINDYLYYGKSERDIETGTGRTEIWLAYFEMIKQKPWFGWGFLVGERMLSTDFHFGVKVISAHNSFLSATVGMGFVGLAFFVYFIADWFLTLAKKMRVHSQYALIMFPAFITFFVNTNSFPAVGTDWNYVALAVYGMYAFAKIRM